MLDIQIVLDISPDLALVSFSYLQITWCPNPIISVSSPFFSLELLFDLMLRRIMRVLNGSQDLAVALS